MRHGQPSGTRHFLGGDPLAVDPGEQTAREKSGEAMLAALAREHPERATDSHPAGTKLPRRLSPPGDGLKSNFEQ